MILPQEHASIEIARRCVGSNMNGVQSEKLVLSFIPHCVEKREILSHKKIFHQINFLVTYLVKPLLSRKLCQNA